MTVTQEQIDNVQAQIDQRIESGVDSVSQGGSVGSSSITYMSLDKLISYLDRLQKLFDRQNGRGMPVTNRGYVKS